MNIFIVHAHPEPQSFNAALTRRAAESLAAAGHDVRISDLYALRFDAVSDRRNFKQARDAAYFKQQIEEQHATQTGGFADEIAAEQEKLFACDALILQFPLWWFSVPAIMKGWFDRVLAAGKTYGGGKWYDHGVFRGKRAMCSLTTGGPPSIYAADGLNGELDMILFPINHGVLRFVGFDVLPPFVAWGPARATPEQREAYLEQYRARLARLFVDEPIRYPCLDEFDETLRRSC